MRSLFAVAAPVAVIYIILSLVSVSIFEAQQSRNIHTVTIPIPSKTLHVRTKTQPPIVKHVIPRFPEYGTPEHSRQCGWAAYETNKVRNCTLFVRPDKHLGEGISLWFALIAQAHQLAQQANCDLVFDYGENINVSSVLTTNGSWNWTTPHDFKCQYPCFHWHPTNKFRRTTLSEIVEQLNKSIAPAPFYRYAYKFKYRHSPQLYEDDFQGLRENIPGFQPETGLACSLSTLFRLSPNLSQFEPDLFTRILPTMHREDALVISLYIRTGQAEQESDPLAQDTSYRNKTQDILSCALEVEKEYLEENTTSFQVVWMVVSDSQDVKQWIARNYETRTRQIITTNSRGAHTKATRVPSDRDFVEAVIDWYLIGESDFVVMDDSSPSFGGTAALRTARPVYDASRVHSKPQCIKTVAIHKGRPVGKESGT